MVVLSGFRITWGGEARGKMREGEGKEGEGRKEEEVKGGRDTYSAAYLGESSTRLDVGLGQ